MDISKKVYLGEKEKEDLAFSLCHSKGIKNNHTSTDPFRIKKH